MQAQPHGVPSQSVIKDSSAGFGRNESLKWEPGKGNCLIAPAPAPRGEQDMVLNLDKDSDFQQHSQYQPDHASSFPFHCYCGHEFHQRKSYRMHILDGLCVDWKDIKIRGNVIVCTCGVEFAQRGSLFRHLRARQCKAYWPDGGRALHCLCGAKFNRRDNMIRHQRSPRCRQNCARLGVTGNPMDVIPPLRKNRFLKPDNAEQALPGHQGEYYEKTLDEAEVNYRWYKQFGNHKRQRTCPPPASSSRGGAAQGPIIVPSPASSSSHKAGHETCSKLVLAPPVLATPQPSLEEKRELPKEQLLTPLPVSRGSSDDNQHDSRRKFTRPSAFYGFQRIQGLATPQPCLVHTQPNPTQEQFHGDAETAAKVEAKPKDEPALKVEENLVTGQVSGNSTPTRDAPRELSQSREPPNNATSSTASIPAAVEPVGSKSQEQMPDEPIYVAIDKLSQRIESILAKYGIFNPSFVLTLSETLKKITTGFVVDSKVPLDRAALLCDTISTGVSQILLLKLTDVTNCAFVQIAHRIDVAAYEELREPLKTLIASTGGDKSSEESE